MLLLLSARLAAFYCWCLLYFALHLKHSIGSDAEQSFIWLRAFPLSNMRTVFRHSMLLLLQIAFADCSCTLLLLLARGLFIFPLQSSVLCLQGCNCSLYSQFV